MIARLGAIALVIPLLSALDSPAVPLGFRILLVILWTLTVARPHWGIAALTVIVPFASWLLLVTNSPPIRYAEALVLATMSGALIAAGRPRRTSLEAGRPDLGMPVQVFAAIVLASAAVTLRVMQTGTHAPWPFIRDFFVFLTHDYLVGPPGSFAGVADAALLIEGVAIVLLVARHARDHVARPAQLLTAVALSGAANALLTVGSQVAEAAATGSAGDATRRLLISRAAVHVADLNAAGSYFAMVGCVALALAVNLRWTRLRPLPLVRAAWGAAAAAIFLAVWITGSRMAILAAIGGSGFVALSARSFRPARWPAWAIGSAAATAVVLLAALALGIDPRPSAARSASSMLAMRGDFMVTGLRMMRSAPIFGVGIGRYFEMSGRFMPASIYWFYFHENAHNNLLQIGGELGLAGLAAFLWLLALATVRLVRGLRADAGDRLLVGAVAGLGAFVATWMTSHPMLVHEVAYPFWLLLGVAMARADGDAQQAPVAQPAGPHAAPPVRPAAVAVIVAVALAASIPLRARRAIGELDFTTQSWGFYGWEGEGADRARWTSRRATFFIPLGARELHLPIRAIHLGTNTRPTEVSIAIGGRTFHRVVLADDNWVSVRLRLPLLPEDEGFQRIDIMTEPTWSPAELFGGRSDVRVLGVLVGEPELGP